MAFAGFLAVALAGRGRAEAETVGLTPLTDLGAGLYLDRHQGGLYPGGPDRMPAAHSEAGLDRARAIVPRDAAGEPDPAGRYVLISIGMSNTRQEFAPFAARAAAHPAVDHERLVIVNGAQGGRPAGDWLSPGAATYDIVAEQLGQAGVTEAQVAAVWLKQANPSPRVSLPEEGADAFTLVRQLGDIVRAAKVRYPNLQVAFLSSRTYAGYATTFLNPEPYAYESAFAVKWLVEAQIRQVNGEGVDPLAGDLSYDDGDAPWLAWGPYLWADGTDPRGDGLTWLRDDFGPDGTHPSPAGREKVADLLLDFMLTSPHARDWFVAVLAEDECLAIAIAGTPPADRIEIAPLVDRTGKGRRFTGSATLLLDDGTEVPMEAVRKLRKRDGSWRFRLRTPKKAAPKVKVRVDTSGDFSEIQKFRLAGEGLSDGGRVRQDDPEAAAPRPCGD